MVIVSSEDDFDSGLTLKGLGYLLGTCIGTARFRVYQA